MNSLERHWQGALFAAIVPGQPGGRLPPLSTIELESFWPKLQGAAPFLVRFGFRFSVIVLTLLPILRYGRLFPQLRPEQQDAFLTWTHSTRSYAIRQLVTVVKLIACFAYFQNGAVQAAVRSPR